MTSFVFVRGERIRRCSITFAIEHSCRQKRKNTTIRVNSQCIHSGFTNNTNAQQRLLRRNVSNQNDVFSINKNEALDMINTTIPNIIPTNDSQYSQRIGGLIPFVINQEQQRHWYQPTTKRKLSNNAVDLPTNHNKTIIFPNRNETLFVTWNRHNILCIYTSIQRIKIQKDWYSTTNIPNSNNMPGNNNDNDNFNHNIPNNNTDRHEKEQDNSSKIINDTNNNDSIRNKSYDNNNSFQSTPQLETNSSSSNQQQQQQQNGGGWIEKYLPNSFQPYAKLSRIDKPIGTMLLLWPCYWSLSLASTTISLPPDPTLFLLFGSGAFIMRSAGCIINDLWDQTYDRQVQRTSTRPIANGDISNRNAILYLGIHLSAGLSVLLSLPNQLYCFQWGVPALLLVGIYPTMKRFFPYPQAFLGLTFNWGCFMGWAAVHGNMDYNIILPLYGSGITWTILYDTIYGHQDKKDDIKLGLYSTAITFGDSEIHQKRILYSLATATFAQWMLVGYQANILDSLYYDIGILSAYGHLLWQVNTANFNDPNNLAQRFISNNTVGGIIFASITAGKYFG